MVRSLLLLIFFSTFLSAQSCYSVALWSIPKKSRNISSIVKNDKNCKIFEISSQITQRCGCYDNVSDARKLLKKYLNKYSSAYVTLTLKSRFEKKIVKKQITAQKKEPKTKKSTNINHQAIIQKNTTTQSSYQYIYLIGLVILISIGFLLFIFRRKKIEKSDALNSILIDSRTKKRRKPSYTNLFK